MDNDPRDGENQIGIHAMIEQEASGELERQQQQQQQQQQQHQFQQPNETSTNNATGQLPNAAAAAAAAAAGLLFQQHSAGSASGSAPTARLSSLIYHQRGAGAGGSSGNANSSSSQQQQQQLRHQASVSSYASASGTGSTSSSLFYASSQHYGGRFGADAARLPFRGGVPERDAEHLQEEDELEFSPASGWSEVELSQDGGGSPPSARSLHAAAVLNGTLLVFGGYDGNQRVNTFHAYSFAEKRWSPVHPSAGSAPAPSPRDRHVMVAFGNSIFIHGGFDGVSRVGDLFCFDFSTMMWREIRALEGRAPSPRHSHSAVVYGSSLFIFGGYDGSYKNDLHECDLLSSRWGVVPAAGRRPRARYRATLCVHKSSMVLFGGHDGTRHLQDVHVFDLETRIWSNLVCEGVPPTPRDSHVSAMHGNCMYIFGGSSGTAMNDLHELQLPSALSSVAKWRAVHTSRTELPRPRFCHVGVVYNESFFTFGGYDGSVRLNDFLCFDFGVYDMSFNVPAPTILQDLRSLINDPTFSDITFIVEEQPVHAHKILLMRSSYFQALFLGSMRESALDTIRLEQVRYPIFLTILEYLYTDQVSFSLSDAMELFEAADLFCIPRLKTMCEKRMLQSITVSNAAAVFHAADVHSAAALRQKAKKYILSHFEEVSKSTSFEEMGRKNIDLVFELLQSR